MVRLTVTAETPLDRESVFDGLVPFDAHLRAAPAVRSVDRDGTGGPGTVYRIELERFGQSTVLETTVTGLSRPASVAWTAERAVTGRWDLEATQDGTLVTIVVDLDERLLDRLELGAGLLVAGLDAILPRLFRREIEAVLGHLVATAGGDPAAVRLLDVSIRRDGRPE